MTRNTFRVFAAAAMVALSVPALSANNHSHYQSTQEAARTLQELRSHKRQLATKLDELNGLARNAHLTSWQNHAILFDEISALINRASREVNRLEVSLDSLPAGKRNAVRAIQAELAQIAPGVQTLIGEMRENQLITLRPSYQTRVRELASRAVEASKSTERVVRAALNSGNQPSGD